MTKDKRCSNADVIENAYDFGIFGNIIWEKGHVAFSFLFFFFFEPFALSRRSHGHIHTYIHICIYSKRNGILKIESPRLAFYALLAYYKSSGAISFIRNKMGASGATHVTDALSSLFGKAELFSILRHFALFINHPPRRSSLLTLLSYSLSLSFSPSPSHPLPNIQVENKHIRYSVIKRRHNTVRPLQQARCRQNSAVVQDEGNGGDRL